MGMIMPEVKFKHILMLCAANALLSVGVLADGQHQAVHHSAPHHLSVLVGGTDLVNEDHTAVTLGLDYEYRVSEFLGLGFVVEQAFGDIDATTLLAVADLHLWHGLIAQVGPGVEFVDGNSHAALRLGMLYEFEFEGGFTLSPQLHYDFSHEDALVFGIALGRAF